MKVRSIRSHMTVEDLRAPPINPGSEEVARARSPRRIPDVPDVASASVCDRRRPIGGRRRVVVWLIAEEVAAMTGLSTCSTVPGAGGFVADGEPAARCKRRSGVFDPAVFLGVEGGLGAVPEPQLPEHVGDVVLDSALRDVELLGYLPVRGPGGD